VERLRSTLSQADILASIGAALSEEHVSLDQTWAKADEAMYRFKTACTGTNAGLGNVRDPITQPTTAASRDST